MITGNSAGFSGKNPDNAIPSLILLRRAHPNC
jgi:hypothetical protein